jgi:phosphohistidine phosphatase
MKLLVMRHAKSSWKHPGLSDWDRPLNKRGRRDAPRMGDLLAAEELVPLRIISSEALRARQTAEAVADAAGYEGDILFVRGLYGGDLSAFLDALWTVTDEVDPVLLIGHNPGVQELVEELTGQWERMPTGAIAYLKLPVQSWAELRGTECAELVRVWQPRDLL